MKQLAITLLLVMLMLVTSASAATREQETAACQDDAQNLCSQYIPDEDAIAACLRGNLKRLSPACRAMFKPARRHR